MSRKYTDHLASVLKKAWDDPLFWRPAKSVSMVWLFPGLIVGATCNQQAWSIGLLLIGRVVSLLTIIAAVVIVWSSSLEKKWPIIILAGLLISKAGRFMFGNSSVLIGFYTVFLALLFCLAGAVIAHQRPKLIYRQVLFFCAISVPLMALQLAGAGEWTQILRTDYHGGDTIAQHPTFLMGSDVVITTLQARPAGFVWANNFLSIIIMFALGLHFGGIHSDNLTWEDVTLCAITVLAMAKIVFLTFLIITLWSYFSGDHLKKQRIKKVSAALLCAILLYALFFPGIFAYNTSTELLVRTFMGRYEDLSMSMGAKYIGGATTGVAFRGHESGYAEILDNCVQYLLITMFLLVPFYYDGVKRLIARYPELKDSTILLLIVVFLVPFITSFLEGAAFWFIAGFGLLPLVLRAQLISETHAMKE